MILQNSALNLRLHIHVICNSTYFGAQAQACCLGSETTRRIVSLMTRQAGHICLDLSGWAQAWLCCLRHCMDKHHHWHYDSCHPVCGSLASWLISCTIQLCWLTAPNGAIGTNNQMNETVKHDGISATELLWLHDIFHDIHFWLDYFMTFISG